VLQTVISENTHNNEKCFIQSLYEGSHLKNVKYMWSF